MRTFVRDLDLLHPSLRDLVARFGSYWPMTAYAKAHPGVCLEVFETYRAPADQLLAYQDGTSNVDGDTHGFACHCCTPALAVDLVVEIGGKTLGVRDGRLTWSPESYGAYAVWGQFAREQGFCWGGDWHSPVDQPHVEIPALERWKAVQRMLQDVGLYRGAAVDGIPGPKTWAAVAQFVGDWAIPKDRLTNALWSALQKQSEAAIP